MHQAAVERPGIAEHEIDAGRLVEEIGLVHVAAQSALPAATPAAAARRVPARGDRSPAPRRPALRPATGRGPTSRPRQARLPETGRQRARLVEQRHQPRQIGVGDRVQRQRRGRLFVACQRRLRGIDLALRRARCDMPEQPRRRRPRARLPRRSRRRAARAPARGGGASATPAWPRRRSPRGAARRGNSCGRWPGRRLGARRWSRPKARAIAPISRSIGVPSWVPEVR